jgi:hypothetical protein
MFKVPRLQSTKVPKLQICEAKWQSCKVAKLQKEKLQKAKSQKTKLQSCIVAKCQSWYKFKKLQSAKVEIVPKLQLKI